ncbi:Uncharacterised protein [Chlamydia trachomatis]|nr:Uncharacterised protein [Chlamydia trachomatis]
MIKAAKREHQERMPPPSAMMVTATPISIQGMIVATMLARESQNRMVLDLSTIFCTCSIRSWCNMVNSC